MVELTVQQHVSDDRDITSTDTIVMAQPNGLTAKLKWPYFKIHDINTKWAKWRISGEIFCLIKVEAMVPPVSVSQWRESKVTVDGKHIVTVKIKKVLMKANSSKVVSSLRRTVTETFTAEVFQSTSILNDSVPTWSWCVSDSCYIYLSFIIPSSFS